jgi:hypothetical protein
MIRRLLAVCLVLALSAGSAFAADIDRHGDYTSKDAAGVSSQKCKSFVGTDDNRSACTDWCSNYIAANSDASCSCDDGACASEDSPPAAAPATAH